MAYWRWRVLKAGSDCGGLGDDPSADVYGVAFRHVCQRSFIRVGTWRWQPLTASSVEVVMQCRDRL